MFLIPTSSWTSCTVSLNNILPVCIFWKQKLPTFCMAVAPASVADKIIVLDGDDNEEESPQPSCSASISSSQHPVRNVSSLKAQQSVPTHITQSPFASAKKDTSVLQAENQRLFTEVSLQTYQPQTGCLLKCNLPLLTVFFTTLYDNTAQLCVVWKSLNNNVLSLYG